MAIVAGAGAGVWVAVTFWTSALILLIIAARVKLARLPLIGAAVVLIIIPAVLILGHLFSGRIDNSKTIVYEYITHIRRSLVAWAVLFSLAALSYINETQWSFLNRAKSLKDWLD